MADDRVRQPVKITSPSTDANEAEVDGSGNLQVLAVGTGTFVVQEDGAALTALELIDDAIFVDDTATHSTGATKGMGIMAVAVPTDVAIEANDIGMPAMSLDRRLHTDTDIVAQTLAALTVTDDGSFTLATNGGTVIGDVNIVDHIPGVGATNLGKAGDAAAASTDTMVAIAAIRDDVLTALSPTLDGEYTQVRVNANGALWVEDVGGGSGTSAVDRAAFTSCTTAFTPTGGHMDEAAPTDVTEGQMGAIRMSANRAMHGMIRDGAGNERSANVTAANELSVTGVVDLGADNDVTIEGGAVVGTDGGAGPADAISIGGTEAGGNFQEILVDSAGAVSVNVLTGGGEAVPVTPTLTIGTTTDLAAGSTLEIDTPEQNSDTRTIRGFTASASVPLKAELIEVNNSVETVKVVLFSRAGEGIVYVAPHRDYHEKTFGGTGGDDLFRLQLTNLDNSQAADVYGTLFMEA